LKNSYRILIFLFLLLGCDRPMKKTLASQKADSLAYFFEKADNDSLPYTERQLYNKKAITIISKDKNDSMNRVNYFKVANRYYNMSDWASYKKTVDLIIKKAEKTNDSASLAKAYEYLSDYYGHNVVFDSLYLSVSKAEKIYSKLGNTKKVLNLILFKASIKLGQKDFAESEKTIFKVLAYLKDYEDEVLEYSCYHLLGNIYLESNEIELAKEFFLKALKIADKRKFSKRSQNKAHSLFYLGLAYQKQKQHKKAIYYFDEALKQPNLFLDHAPLYANIKDNLGYSKMKLGDYTDLPDLFYESLKIADSLNKPGYILTVKNSLSEYYISIKDTAKAVALEKEINTLSKKYLSTKYLLESLQRLSLFDRKNANLYIKEYFKINDSIQLGQLRNRNKFARIEFETEGLALEKDKLTQQKSILIYLAVGILLFAVTLFVIRHQITKNKELRLLQEQQNANEEIYQLMLDQQQKIEEGRQLEKKRISRELHDGVMGRLSGIRLNLFVLGRKTDPETIAKSLDHISEIQEVEREIRTIAYDLEKKVFSDTVGFVTIVSNLFSDREGHSGLHFIVDVEEDIEWEALSGNNKMNLYRILQESLQNINKYADADTVALRMQKAGSAIAVTIEDDGTGFDIRKIKKGLGLKNMEERADEMNATIDILSEEGRGTKINLIIPV